MTVRVTQKMRKRIDARKRIVAMKKEKELVTDNSHRDIHKRGFIYESPDGGKTIYRRTAGTPSAYKGSIEFYDEVAGVRLDKHPEQLEFKLDNKNSQRIKKLDDILDKLNAIEAQIREVRATVIDLE